MWAVVGSICLPVGGLMDRRDDKPVLHYSSAWFSLGVIILLGFWDKYNHDLRWCLVGSNVT